MYPKTLTISLPLKGSTSIKVSSLKIQLNSTVKISQTIQLSTGKTGNPWRRVSWKRQISKMMNGLKAWQAITKIKLDLLYSHKESYQILNILSNQSKILSEQNKLRRRLRSSSVKKISIFMMPQLRTLRKKKVRSRGLFQTACQVKNATFSKAILSLFTTKRVRERLLSTKCQIYYQDALKRCRNKDKFSLMPHNTKYRTR